jgi:hypothetical protein
MTEQERGKAVIDSGLAGVVVCSCGADAGGFAAVVELQRQWTDKIRADQENPNCRSRARETMTRRVSSRRLIIPAQQMLWSLVMGGGGVAAVVLVLCLNGKVRPPKRVFFVLLAGFRPHAAKSLPMRPSKHQQITAHWLPSDILLYYVYSAKCL